MTISIELDRLVKTVRRVLRESGLAYQFTPTSYTYAAYEAATFLDEAVLLARTARETAAEGFCGGSE